MTDYTNYIEGTLNRLMPEDVILLEKEGTETVYAKNAPKIKGYFKFISLRFPLRMKDIKKMCVEYINTYVESCLNVAKNMDDVRIMDEQKKDTLAADLNFSKMGINTNGEKKEATTKEGVLFLTGDKALLDKVNAIAEKITARASKNKILAEWANLMLIQSRIIANDIVRKETTKLLKEEKNRKEAEKLAEEKAKKEQAEFETKEKERMASQKTNSTLYAEYGSPDEVIAKLKLTKKEIKKMFNGIEPDFFNEKLADESDNTKLDDKVDINQKRLKFYQDCGADGHIKDAIKFATKDASETPVQHFVFASYMVENCDITKGEYPCPLDIMIATFNNANVNINEEVKEPIDGIKKEKFTNKEIDANKVFKKSKKYLDKGYTLKCSFIYLSTLSKLNSILESKGAVLTSSQFIAESIINAQKERIENEMILIEVISDYDNTITLDSVFRTRFGNVVKVTVDENGKPVFLDENDVQIDLPDRELNTITYYIINKF